MSKAKLYRVEVWECSKARTGFAYFEDKALAVKAAKAQVDRGPKGWSYKMYLNTFVVPTSLEDTALLLKIVCDGDFGEWIDFDYEGAL